MIREPIFKRLSPATQRRVCRFLRRFRQNTLAVAGFIIILLLFVMAIFAPYFAPYDITQTNVDHALEAPSLAHPFGTDRYGRDILSRVIVGSRIALQVAITVPLVAMVVGVPIGLLAGYFGGRFDNVLMRFMDGLFAFPSILLGLTLVAVFGQSLLNIIVALGIVFIPQFARITRGATVSVVTEDHIKAAQSLGASHARIIIVHILPFCLSAIVVQATITAALAILLESSLSFLGIGVSPPPPSWGTMLRSGREFIHSGYWWYSTFPGLAIVISVLGFNLLGDGLRDVLDPRTSPNR
ncbi:MAG: ABC transporter permease [Halobacteriaceae archaeon]